MASLTCYVPDFGDEKVTDRMNTFYPPTTPYGPYSDRGAVKNKDGSDYQVTVGFIRFDTGGLPNDAVITSAVLRLRVLAKANIDSRNFNVEWYSNANWPIDDGDYVLLVGTDAAVIALSSVPAADDWLELNLSTPTSVSLTGNTGFRLGISGGQPTAQNVFAFYPKNTPSTSDPELVVTYDSANYANKVLGCLPATIAKIMGIPTANVGKFCGV